jgi:hypothetical protein
MKRIVLALLLPGYMFVHGQSDSLKTGNLDSLSTEDLYLYYLTQPEPPQFSKGPTIGDSIYYDLLPQTVPTKTVEGEPSLFRRYYPDSPEEAVITDTTSQAEQRFKPKIAIGAGSLAYHGDLYQKGSRFKSPLTGKPAFDLCVSQRLTRYLQLNFNFVIGQLGANEFLNNRQENFQSEIRAGGINLIYDFGNWISDKHRVRPYVSLGITGFEFLSKTDIKDLNGNTYYYWSDGSIKNMQEGSVGSQYATELKRDYRYESDVRELNRDGFGKYPERAWAFPVGFGVMMKITDRIDMRMNFQYFPSTTDYIDGITDKSLNNRAGTAMNDNFSYTSISIQYDLITRKKTSTAADTLSDAYWLAFDDEDRDGDGVTDFKDDCHGTPSGAKVGVNGCPLDEDGDGVPNYMDDELTTAAGAPVTARGVTQDDAYWQAWYAQYLNDSVDVNMKTEETRNIFAAADKKDKKKKSDDIFTVELVRYNGSIPTDELAFLLSIGDINSTTLPDGTTVVYTSGNYDMLKMAVKRRDEFRTEGNKGAGISKLVGNDIIQVPEDEVMKLLNNEIEDLGKMDIDSAANTGFGKDDFVYRVQLGAFKNRISTNVFNTAAGVLELKTGENIYRYVTKGYRTIEEAAGARADLVLQGYNDAFVTAYKSGKRIALNETKATVDKAFKEDLREDKMFSSVDKKLIVFKVQLGPLKRGAAITTMDEKVKILSDYEKQATSTGAVRFTTGTFTTLAEAEGYQKELADNGFYDAFVIATFKNDIISMQEAMDLLK